MSESHNDHTKCRSLLGFLSDYVDGNLSDDLCQEIEDHAAGCENCRIVVDTLRKTISLYNQTGAEPVEISGKTREQLFKTLKLEDYMSK